MASGERSGGLSSDWRVVNGLCWHALVATGAGKERPPVVLVHGLMVSSRYLAPLAARLAPDFRVYAPDLPGFGRSAKPRQVLTLPALADGLAAWLDSLAPGPAIFFGNSFGCQVIVEFARRHPARLTHAILQGVTVDPARRSLPGLIGRLLLDGLREPPSLLPIVLRDYAAAGLRRLVGTTRAMLADRIEEKLPLMPIPTLIVHGARDPIGRPEWAARAARLLPCGRLVVVPGAAHALNFSRPDLLASLIASFLGESASRPPTCPADARRHPQAR